MVWSMDMVGYTEERRKVSCADSAVVCGQTEIDFPVLRESVGVQVCYGTIVLCSYSLSQVILCYVVLDYSD